MKLFIFLLFFISNLETCYSQQGENYLSIMNNLKAIDTITETLSYKNGKIKSIFTHIIYKYNNEEISILAGKSFYYYKNGNHVTTIFDPYGLPLVTEYYDKSNNLISCTKLEFFETNAKTIEDFIKYKKDNIYEMENKEYKILKNHKKTYLYSCGKLRNGKKIGTWVYFDENGKIKKQKAH
jgi:hypothetical protein